MFFFFIERVSWSSTNVLIAALALSDLLTVCCTTPTEIASVVYDLEIWVILKYNLLLRSVTQQQNL